MDKNIHFLLQLRTKQLQREGLASLTLDQLINVMNHTFWLNRMPNTLSEISEDIDNLSAEVVTDYLTSHRMIQNQFDRVSNLLNDPY